MRKTAGSRGDLSPVAVVAQRVVKTLKSYKHNPLLIHLKIWEWSCANRRMSRWERFSFEIFDRKRHSSGRKLQSGRLTGHKIVASERPKIVRVPDSNKHFSFLLSSWWKERTRKVARLSDCGFACTALWASALVSELLTLMHHWRNVLGNARVGRTTRAHARASRPEARRHTRRRYTSFRCGAVPVFFTCARLAATQRNRVSR